MFASTLRIRSAGIVGADMTPGYDILDFSTIIRGKGDLEFWNWWIWDLVEMPNALNLQLAIWIETKEIYWDALIEE